MKNVAELIDRVFHKAVIEVCYVTRTYATRHGAGNLDNECDYRELNMSLYDKTNVENPFQGKLRYGKLDTSKLLSRVLSDYNSFEKRDYHTWIHTLAVTHTNEYELDDLDDLSLYLSDIYTSDSEDRRSVF